MLDLVTPVSVVGAARVIAERDLHPLVGQIDREGHYPESVLRAFGEAGVYGSHVSGIASGRPDLKTAIEAMSVASEYCLSTSFCMWCQSALAWYVYTSDNPAPRDEIGAGVVRADRLGGTGLSNPMKTFFGIERMRLKGRRVAGGYIVKGVLPWVSNLGPDHYFGGVFEIEDDPKHRVMAVFDCSADGVRLVQNDHFVALEGTRTYCVQIRDTFIPDERVLADSTDDYIPRIRAGFILLQAGMAFGLIKGCIDLMRQERPHLSHVNRYLQKQPEDFEAQFVALEEEVWRLCAEPFEVGSDYFRRVIEARLAAGEAAVEAAHFAMLHQGAKGYLANAAAQRRLREAYFVAIVTPATKQLRKMLADLAE